MENSEYLSEDCIVKDEIYCSLINFIICPLCNKIYKDPMICDNCTKVYCNNCIKKEGNLCPNGCKNSKIKECTSKSELLSKIKYKCKNCSEIVKGKNIKSHLELNCTPNIIKERKLSEIYQTKKKLKKISLRNYDNVSSFTSKKKYI